MSAETAKKETLTCSNCGHTLTLNAWGIPIRPLYDGHEGAIKRARGRLRKETGFGIKEKNETDKKRSKESSKKTGCY